MDQTDRFPCALSDEQIVQEILPRYEEALAWLYSFFTEPEQPRAERPRRTSAEWRERMPKILERMELWYTSIGRPQERFPAVHIAGTGGKGSTSMLIAKLLEGTAGRVGVHCSPYLQVPGEKLVINGRMIAPSRFVEIVSRLQAECRRFQGRFPEVRLTHGMIQVALFFLYFAESDLDWGVIETGLGGRFDLTNVLMPELSVITNIDFDHVNSLGPELWRIAWQKAGIIKAGAPAITGEAKPEALAEIRSEAQRKGARLYQVDEDWSWETVSMDASGMILDVRAPYGRYEQVWMPILGPFQGQNAGMAIAAVDVLAHESGVQLEEETVRCQMAEARLPGRLEVMQEEPLVILDGAHNPQKARSLAEAMHALYSDRDYTLVFGMLGTKDAANSLAHLLPQASRVAVTQPLVKGKRAAEPSELADVVRALDSGKPLDVYPSVTDALVDVLGGAASGDLVLVTGSLYMIGEAREYWVPSQRLLIEAERGLRYL
jgi:dihydrofolate synthase/folylpolyglutamate synthase